MTQVRLIRLATVLAMAGILAIGPGGAAAQNGRGIDLAGIGYDRGNPDAPIAIVEFGDFACSACGLFARETFGAVNREFILPGRVQWKYVPFALGAFPNGESAAIAAECAAEQSAFWSMHDLLYERQKEWSRAREPGPLFERYARELGLAVDAFSACSTSERVAGRVVRNNEIARALGIRATPTFFINGFRVRGAIPIEQFRRIVAEVTQGGGTRAGDRVRRR